MHATIQKPLEEILSFFKKGEKVFIMVCSNCAAKCNSGGEEETRFMAERLKEKSHRNRCQNYQKIKPICQSVHIIRILYCSKTT